MNDDQDHQRDETLALFGFVFVVVVLFFSIFGSLGCTATRGAGVRRMAEAQYDYCHGGRVNVKACVADVRAYCVAQGLEKTCGEGGP